LRKRRLVVTGTFFFLLCKTFLPEMSLRASPLKIPQRALPLDPTTFEKVDKTFNCHRYTMEKSFQPLRGKLF